MNNHSRTKNTIFNFIGNIAYELVILILAFATRRVFIKSLGVEYLGINGLFTNILSVLSLAELGIGSAIYYSMYKAVADKDKNRIASLTNYYKSLYNKIAVLIFVIGIALMPFLKYIVKFEESISNIELYYFINLLSSVFSYLFVYKTSVLYADQSGYKLRAVNIVVQLVKSIGSILIIYFTKNYVLYISFEALFGLLGNIVCSKIAEKIYPFINEKVSLEKQEKKGIWENIKAMFLYKFSNIILNNTDNIIISIITGTNMVGYYSNYTMIYNKIFGVTSMFFNSFNSSIGNLNANSTKEKKYEIFKIISFLSFWVFSFACIGVFFVGEDMIKAMTSSESFVLGKEILIITVMIFYLKVSKNAIAIYRDTTGLFKLSRYSLLISSLLNIILSVILGKVYGLFGILLATLIARLLSDVWYEPYMLYKRIFEKNVKEYFFEQIKYVILTLIIIALMFPFMNLINIPNLYVDIIVKFIICCIVPNTIYLLIFWNNNEFKYILNKFKDIFGKIKANLIDKKKVA